MRKLLFLPLLFSLLSGCGNVRTDQMRTLLHEQDSLNRAYQHLSLDTIHQLTDYFDRHGPNYDRVHSHYLLGSALRDLREAPAALDAFQQAAELADTTAGGDSIYALLAKIHGQMGSLFNKQYLSLQAKEAYQTAARNAMAAKDTLLALNFLRLVVSSFYQQHQFDSIDRFSERIAYELRRRGDTVNAARTFGVAISANIERDSLEKAKAYMDIYEQEGEIYDGNGNVLPYLSIYNYYRGLYFLKKGEPTEAERLFRDVVLHADDIEQLKGGYDGLRRTYTILGRRDSALKYTTLYADANDTCYFHQTREETLNMQSLYDYGRIRNLADQKSLQLEKTKSHTVVLGAFSLIVIFGLITVLYLYRKKKVREIIQKQLSYLIAQDEIKELELRIKEEKEQVAQSTMKRQEQQQAIHDLTQEVGQLKYKLLTLRPKGKLHDTLKNLARTGIGLCPSDWNEIMDFMEENDPLFLPKLNKACPTLTIMETRLCILTRMGYSVGDIAVLMDKSVQSISKGRNHLMKKIFNDSNGAKPFDTKIQQL